MNTIESDTMIQVGDNILVKMGTFSPSYHEGVITRLTITTKPFDKGEDGIPTQFVSGFLVKENLVIFDFKRKGFPGESFAYSDQVLNHIPLDKP